MILALEAIFGNRSAANVMMFIQSYGSGYASEIARTFETPISVVQDQLKRLEGEGVLVSRTLGRTRVFEFNPRNPTVSRLQRFLVEELDALPRELVKKYFRTRQRPRRSGKSLAARSDE